MLGQHAMKHWSSTQASIALSSGEAEFAGVIRGAGQGLGYQSLLRDLGVSLPLRVWTDSSAAVGICTRQGLGKLRHLDTHTLWTQQAVRTGRVELRKVLGEQNPADLLTKHSISRRRLEDLITLLGCKYLGGRAGSAPLVRKGESARMTMAQADQELSKVSAADEEQEEEGETSPTMPHLEHPLDELERLYPKFVSPPDENCEFQEESDLSDTVFQQGMKVAEEIRRASESQGRKKRPDGTADVSPLDDEESSTSRAPTLGRRRSRKSPLPPQHQHIRPQLPLRNHSEQSSSGISSDIHSHR